MVYVCKPWFVVFGLSELPLPDLVEKNIRMHRLEKNFEVMAIVLGALQHIEINGLTRKKQYPALRAAFPHLNCQLNARQQRHNNVRDQQVGAIQTCRAHRCMRFGKVSSVKAVNAQNGRKSKCDIGFIIDNEDASLFF